MATAAKRTIKRIEDASEDFSGNLAQQIAALRKEIASITEAVQDYSGTTLEDMQHNAAALAREVRHQGAIAARQVGHQANVAGKVVRENPVPVLVTLATIALLSTLLFHRD